MILQMPYWVILHLPKLVPSCRPMRPVHSIHAVNITSRNGIQIHIEWLEDRVTTNEHSRWGKKNVQLLCMTGRQSLSPCGHCGSRFELEIIPKLERNIFTTLRIGFLPINLLGILLFVENFEHKIKCTSVIIGFESNYYNAPLHSNNNVCAWRCFYSTQINTTAIKFGTPIPSWQ